MKQFKSYITILVLVIGVVSCGGGDELEAKKEELTKKKDEMAALKTEISQLEKEISTLDPDFNKQDNEILVASLPVKKTTFTHQIEIRGSVASRNNVLLSAETMGRVTNVYVKEGASVKKGELLVALDATILENNIAEVETQLELAVIMFERQSNLWEQNIGTEIQYLQAKNSKETLERRLNTLKSQLRQYYVRAPFNGEVDAVPIKIGEMAQPGVPLVHIVNPRDMYIKADVSEAYLGKIVKGSSVEVNFPIKNKSFTSSINSVSKVINPDNRTFTVEVGLPESSTFEFQPNQVVVISLIDYENKDAIAIPTKLIQTDQDGKFVFVVDENEGKMKAKKARVSTGLNYASKTEILAGLNEGEILIEKGYRDVNEGVEIKIASR
jgi:RND family efflux transporter MFP subunit